MQNKYYRISFNGEGIYEVLKKSIFKLLSTSKAKEKWQSILKDPRITWLPKPKIDYNKSNKSYFTQLGYDTFKSKTLKLIKEINPELVTKLTIDTFDKLPIDESKRNKYISYEDEYQVVITI